MWKHDWQHGYGVREIVLTCLVSGSEEEDIPEYDGNAIERVGEDEGQREMPWIFYDDCTVLLTT